MKKAIIFLILIINGVLISNKANAQVDSMKILRDGIYNLKANYIGNPLSKLLTDLKVSVSFADPDNAVPRTKGMAYYQDIKVYLPTSPLVPVWDFKIRLANKVTTDLSQMRSTIRSSSRAA